MPSVVLASFVGAYDLLGIGHRGRLVETLPECVSDKGFRCGVMFVDPSMDVFQQVLPLLDGDAMLRGSSVVALVELPFDDDEGRGMTREPSGLCLVGREHLVEEAIEIRCSLVSWRVGLHHWEFDEFHDLEVGWN